MNDEELKAKVAKLSVAERTKMVEGILAPLQHAAAEHGAGRLGSPELFCIAEATLSTLDLLDLPGMGSFRDVALKAIEDARAAAKDDSRGTE